MAASAEQRIVKLQDALKEIVRLNQWPDVTQMCLRDMDGKYAYIARMALVDDEIEERELRKPA